MNIYELSRVFWDYSFENPGKIKPNHIAMYFFAIEHCNRLGWKDKFGFPASLVMEAIGISSYNTYIKTFNDLVKIGFIKVIQRSKNQYTANIIALSKFDKAHDKALDKAMIKHMTKQSESNDSIDIPIYNTTNLQDYKYTNRDLSFFENENSDFSWILKSDFFKKITEFFSQNTEHLKRNLYGDLISIQNKKIYAEFEKQTEAYISFKKLSGEKTHRWQNYLADWQDENWIEKLEKFRNEKSNNQNGNKAGRISGRSTIASGDFNYSEFADDY